MVYYEIIGYEIIDHENIGYEISQDEKTRYETIYNEKYFANYEIKHYEMIPTVIPCEIAPGPVPESLG